MDKVIIGIAYIFGVYLFYNLIRIRTKGENERINKVYVAIVSIILLIFVWNIFRQ